MSSIGMTIATDDPETTWACVSSLAVIPLTNDPIASHKQNKPDNSIYSTRGRASQRSSE